MVHKSLLPLEFGMEEVVRWLWPEEIVRRLKDAYPYAAVTYHSVAQLDDVFVPGRDGTGGLFNLKVDTTQAGMCTPALQNMHEVPYGGFDMIEDTIRKLETIVREFNTVRMVVNWMNDYATPGAARYYFPVLGTLLPPDHPFHSCGAARFKEPTANIAPMIPLIRESLTIVTQGLLLGDLHGQQEAMLTPGQRPGLRVSVESKITDAETTSQEFTLL